MRSSPRKAGQTQMRLNAICIATLTNELLDGPCTTADLALVSGLSLAAVRRYIGALRAKQCLRVVAWERDAHNRQSIAVYHLGRGKDVPKAAPLPRATGRTPFLRLERLAA